MTVETTQDNVENGVIPEEESDQALLEKSKRMYREYILDHYANPRNHGRIENPDGTAHEENPSCGDTITTTIKTDNGELENVKFEGDGCAISIAAASILTTQIQDKSLETVRDMETEDMLEMLGLELTPTRVKCAVLGLHTVKQALHNATTERGAA